MNEIKDLEMIRKGRKMSQERIAQEIGVTLQTYWRWVKHRNNPSPVCMILIAKYIKKYTVEV